jgi:hypothetical protein
MPCPRRANRGYTQFHGSRKQTTFVQGVTQLRQIPQDEDVGIQIDDSFDIWKQFRQE